MNLKTLLYFYPINKVTHCYDIDNKPIDLSQEEWDRIIKSRKHVCGFKKIPFKHLKSEDKQKVIKYALIFVHNKIKEKEDATRMVEFLYIQETRRIMNEFLHVPNHIIKK